MLNRLCVFLFVLICLGVIITHLSNIFVLYRLLQVARLLCDDKGTRFKVAFGMPTLAHEDDGVRTVLAAIEIMHMLRRKGQTAAIGIATGVVYCGEAGSQKRCEYTAVGFKVIMAARLMQVAGDGGILCETETWESAQGKVTFEKRFEPVKLKGVSKPVDVYRPHALTKTAKMSKTSKLLGIKEGKRKMKLHESLLSNQRKKRNHPRVRSSVIQGEDMNNDSVGMVGRKAEGSYLLSLLGTVVNSGNTAVALVEAEGGMGKSTLIYDHLQHALNFDIEFFYGAGGIMEKRTPYYCWRQIFEQLLGIDETNAKQITKRTKLVTEKLKEHPSLLEWCALLNPILATKFEKTSKTNSLTVATRGPRLQKLMLSILMATAKPLKGDDSLLPRSSLVRLSSISSVPSSNSKYRLRHANNGNLNQMNSERAPARKKHKKRLTQYEYTNKSFLSGASSKKSSLAHKSAPKEPKKEFERVKNALEKTPETVPEEDSSGGQNSPSTSSTQQDSKHINKAANEIAGYTKRVAIRVIVVEDLQWIDSGSFELAVEVAKSIPGLFVIFTHRPLGRILNYTKLERLERTRKLTLEVLSTEECIKLAKQIIGVEEVPHSFVKIIQERAMGHPMYIEELSRAMIDNQIIEIERRSDNSAVAVENPLFKEPGKELVIPERMLPTTVHGVLVGRIDKLEPEQQLMLKLCSVIGLQARTDMIKVGFSQRGHASTSFLTSSLSLICFPLLFNCRTQVDTHSPLLSHRLSTPASLWKRSWWTSWVDWKRPVS